MVRTAQEPVGKSSIGWPDKIEQNAPVKAASFPLAKSSMPVPDEDEWEFEYSSTETEVRLRITFPLGTMTRGNGLTECHSLGRHTT